MTADFKPAYESEEHRHSPERQADKLCSLAYQLPSSIVVENARGEKFIVSKSAYSENYRPSEVPDYLRDDPYRHDRKIETTRVEISQANEVTDQESGQITIVQGAKIARVEEEKTFVPHQAVERHMSDVRGRSGLSHYDVWQEEDKKRWHESGKLTVTVSLPDGGETVAFQISKNDGGVHRSFESCLAAVSVNAGKVEDVLSLVEFLERAAFQHREATDPEKKQAQISQGVRKALSSLS